MAKQHETGHSRNLANMELLITLCTAIGAKYNPGNTAIKLPALQTALTAAKESSEKVMAKKTVLLKMINDREEQFRGLPSISTRVLNLLIASGASTNTVADCKFFVRK